MSAPATGSFPYPGSRPAGSPRRAMTAPMEAVRDSTPGPSFIPHLPVRKPFASLAPELEARLRARSAGGELGRPVRPLAREADPYLLQQTLRGLRRLPDERDGSVYAAAHAAHVGLTPQAPQAHPAHVPALPGDGGTRAALADAFWLAHQWYADPDEGDSGKSELYARIHDAVKMAPDDASAVALLRAAVAEGGADLGDITPGSLEDIGGAR